MSYQIERLKAEDYDELFDMLNTVFHKPKDAAFDVEKYILQTSAKSIAKAEEEAFFAQEELRNEKRSEGAYLESDYETEE